MPALTPRQVHEQFTEAFKVHDLDALIALYDPDGVMVPGPGEKPVRGHLAIRKALEALQKLKPSNVELKTVFCIERDDLALTRSRWHFTGTSPDGQPVHMAGSGTEVMRRRPDGTWVHLFDNPWGGDVLD
ncbi:SgcJ/EcaC family oxidoreductase [Pelagibius litoralis]|uniref:SgcJ/EcaC family oxidoreductase n=1 Tax=Pelagibius litoralis TaxID=374515 RepID=A0A967F1T4_9PROT|nr:SgcJ/EcaC family oxidoreductase [Pelagibius litoralis]NIA71464.1 SgcJ/EcaC family oxidoreductase [Pelagibius litoralis]